MHRQQATRLVKPAQRELRYPRGSCGAVARKAPSATKGYVQSLAERVNSHRRFRSDDMEAAD